MKTQNIMLVLFFTVTFCFSQDATTAQAINKEAWEAELSQSVKQEMAINFPVFKVYDYIDSKGAALLVLTESNEKTNAKGEPINLAVAAFLLRGSNGSFTKEWENKHNIIENTKKESSIWYWSKYFECSDADNDGESETFLIFGTAGENGLDDGRIFIEIYYKGKLVSIEHQNSVLDLHRVTLISPSFYNLPQTVQNKVIYKMKVILNAKQAIFPTNWEQSMANKKTEIRE